MGKLSEISISFFSSATDNIPKKALLINELTAIKEGRVKELIQRCRSVLSEGNKAEYSSLKRGLPGVTYAATFKGKRAKDFCDLYNGLLIIDFDEIENLNEDRSALVRDEYTLAAWISPSGKGIKVLVKIASDIISHKFCFDAISDYYFEKYNLETDKSGSDISRLCFTSYDPDLFLNEDSQTWTIQKLSVKTSKSKDGLKAESTGNKKELKITTNPNVTEGKNDSKDRTTIKQVIKFLSKNNKSITTNYQNWYRVALAMASAFTPDIGIKHYIELCKLDKESHNEDESQSMIEYCYRNNKGEIKFATIIHLANEVGFK